jgi:hypothetical protein
LLVAAPKIAVIRLPQRQAKKSKADSQKSPCAIEEGLSPSLNPPSELTSLMATHSARATLVPPVPPVPLVLPQVAPEVRLVPTQVVLLVP